jgi:hypothetical protein
MQGFEVKFNIYAETQEEADAVSQVVKDFISENARKGVAVTANKVVQAVRRWGGNSFLRNQIINYFR